MAMMMKERVVLWERTSFRRRFVALSRSTYMEGRSYFGMSEEDKPFETSLEELLQTHPK